MYTATITSAPAAEQKPSDKALAVRISGRIRMPMMLWSERKRHVRAGALIARVSYSAKAPYPTTRERSAAVSPELRRSSSRTSSARSRATCMSPLMPTQPQACSPSSSGPVDAMGG